MTTEEINKAIREEAEKRFTYYVDMVKNSKEINYLRKGLREAFIEGAKFREELGLSIKPSTNLQQQNENESLNNSEKLYRWVKASDRLPDFVESDVCYRDKEGNYNAMYISWNTKLRADYDFYEWLEEINPQPSPELKAEEKIQESDSKKKTNENI